MKNIKFIKKHIFIIIIAIITIFVISVIVQYQVEGEKNLPFQVSKIMVISNAYGIQQHSEYQWDLEVVQNNDIYIDIIKNKNNSKEEIIDKVIFDNFEIDKAPKKGEIVLYNPQSIENSIYYNEEQYKIEKQLEYIGNEEKSDIKNFQISNQGGLVFLRIVNQNLGKYTSNEQKEIRHDGTLLKQIGITNEELSFNISFDISIQLKSEKRYRARIKLKMPKEDLTQEGTTHYQISGVDELVFKRY
ncbi:MAG: hypothetical protein HFJ27_01545 [Clostridia bacterium]|nr:hypothetical protein [Clostridia bacterium]